MILRQPPPPLIIRHIKISDSKWVNVRPDYTNWQKADTHQMSARHRTWRAGWPFVYITSSKHSAGSENVSHQTYTTHQHQHELNTDVRMLSPTSFHFLRLLTKLLWARNVRVEIFSIPQYGTLTAATVKEKLQRAAFCIDRHSLFLVIFIIKIQKYFASVSGD